MSTSQVYAVLKRLEIQGYIEGSTAESEDAPPRTEYTVTPSGREQLQNWLYDSNPSTSVRRIRVEFFSKLYVAGLLAIPAQKIIDLQREACQIQRQKMNAIHNQAQTPLEKQVSEFVIGQLDAAIDWLEAFEKEYTGTGK
jgi:DNA-binding PadR family transcriptional regulator